MEQTDAPPRRPRQVSNITVPLFGEIEGPITQANDSCNLTPIPASGRSKILTSYPAQGVGSTRKPSCFVKSTSKPVRIRFKVRGSTLASPISPEKAETPMYLGVGTAPLSEEMMQRIQQYYSQEAMQGNVKMQSAESSASKQSTKSSAKPGDQPASSQSSPKVDNVHRLLDEQKILLAQLDAFEQQGYTAYLTGEKNESPSQNIAFKHKGETEKDDEVLNAMIDENYVLRIRLQAVKNIKRDGLRAGWGAGNGDEWTARICGYDMVCTFP